MDETDLNILKMLRDNSRESLGKISEVLGISKATVSRRLSRIEQEGFITGYTIIPNPNRMGLMNVGHLSGYSGIAAASHAARGDAFCCSPLIKVAFADKNMPFDFANITKEFGRGALREFMPAGERTVIIPAQ